MYFVLCRYWTSRRPLIILLSRQVINIQISQSCRSIIYEYFSANLLQHSTSCICLSILSRIARKITTVSEVFYLVYSSLSTLHVSLHFFQWIGFDKIILCLIILHTIFFALKWNGMSLTTELIIHSIYSILQLYSYTISVCFDYFFVSVQVLERQLPLYFW